MSFPLDFENDARIQNTLQELCVAEFARHYCRDCASGQGCCVNKHADQQKQSMGSSYPEEMNDRTKESEEMERNENSHPERKVRRQKLTIDLSNDEDLSDGEILRRLLSPLGSPLSDEPLEVILEIVDEEDEDDEIDDEIPTPKKTFRSLREKLREVTNSGFSNRESKSRFRKEPKRMSFDGQYSCPNGSNKSSTNSYSSVKMCPSFQKANSLINEIEKCFTETAVLVEKTLASSNCPRNELKSKGINPQVTRSSCLKSSESDQLTTTIEEALQIFDSIISENKNQIESREKNISDNGEPKNKCTENLPNHFDSSENVQNDNDQAKCLLNTPSPTFKQHNSDSNEIKSNKKHLISTFERDVDELFKECYAVSSLEPSTSLGSCLKNLERLCFQLNRAKDNILLEMKEKYNKKVENWEDNFDSNASQTSSLDSQECFSFINELIEQKLKYKLKEKKFSLDPPLMGLEGRTHKIIAEVFPTKLTSENEKYTDKENELSHASFRGNNFRTQDSAYGSNNTVNMSSVDNDMCSESNSEISTPATTLNSNRCVFYSPQVASDRSEEHFKFSLSESEEEHSPCMSYEETLALYEDNQELQKSLLSILHSLNDIHDNFLNRRRMEIAMSQKSSNSIHNYLKSEICSLFQSGNEFQEEILPENSSESVNSYTKELNYEDKRILSNKMNGDFESIKKIISVSDELKNMWLYGTDDVRLRNRKPSRSVSFSRGQKRYNRFLKQIKYSDEVDYPSVMNEKSLSMPNLSNFANENYRGSPDGSSGSSLTSSHSSTFREGTRDHFMDENSSKQKPNDDSEYYDVRLNFLQRIMDACVLAEREGKPRCDFVQTECIHPYKAYLRTCS